VSEPVNLSPVVREKSGLSPIWLIPIITALLGSWLIYHSLTDKGPLVTITFHTAEGIEADKTRIKYKSLSIGMVEGVKFSQDFARVEVKIRLNKEATHFLKRDTRFWVVRPTLSARGISGLGTLLSGTYIEVEPGEGAPQSLFVGLESPPMQHGGLAGKRITLLAKQLGSLDRGSPIYYQGIVAGEVLGYEMANDYRNVLVHAFVKAPYDTLLRSHTRFWSGSGIDLTVGADGMRLKTESLQSMLFGGIAFDTPDITNANAGGEDIAGLVFTLHDDFKAIQEQAYVSKLRYVLHFEDSVRGLTVGAPVEFKGIKVGSVTDVHLEYNEKTASFRIPVQVEIEPERIAARGEQLQRASRDVFEGLIKRGLRARLQTGNMLTGQLFVDLVIQPKTPLKRGEKNELPTVRGVGMEQIMASAGSIMEQLGRVDYAALGADLQGTLKGANVLVNGPHLNKALEELATTLKSVRVLLGALEGRAEPIADNLERTLVAAREALEKAKSTMALVDGAIAPEAPLHHHAVRLAQELTITTRSLRHLVETLERNPQALLLGKPVASEKESR